MTSTHRSTLLSKLGRTLHRSSHFFLHLFPSLLSAMVAAFLLAISVNILAQESRIHPYTQQTYTQWENKLDATEAVTRPGGDPEKALPVLEATEEWFKEKQQTLERHPDYKVGLKRQLTLRIKQARITAVMGLVFADTAAKQQKTALLDGKGGAYDQLEKADKLVQSLIAVLGPDQDPVKDVAAYVENVRSKVKEKANMIKGAGDINMATAAGVRLHPFTKQTFEKWVANLEEDIAILAGPKSVEGKISELENGRRWFQSNHQELVKHPGFEQGMAKMNQLMLGLAELKGKRAVEFAEKGLKEMNSNMFNESSGTYQQIKDAEKLVAEFGKGGDSAKANSAIANAKAAVESLSEQYSTKAAASFRLPAETYNGGDKSRLRDQIVAKWKENYPGDQVLGVRFLKPDWERRKESNYNNGSWYHYDNSVLLAYVVIKKSGELATVYPAYVNKNNQSGAITIGAQTKGGSYSHQDMLMKHVNF
ncbi:hypothetical protein BH11PSE11_BH11PSE11_13450 [soil metagenome]